MYQFIKPMYTNYKKIKLHEFCSQSKELWTLWVAYDFAYNFANGVNLLNDN